MIKTWVESFTLIEHPSPNSRREYSVLAYLDGSKDKILDNSFWVLFYHFISLLTILLP